MTPSDQFEEIEANDPDEALPPGDWEPTERWAVFTENGLVAEGTDAWDEAISNALDLPGTYLCREYVFVPAASQYRPVDRPKRKSHRRD